MPFFYKYRQFDSGGFWRRIFTHGEFWFSVPEKLDDEEEVLVQYDLPECLIDRSHENLMRKGTSILSLGCESDNEGLWERYGDQKKGFCVEADFNAFDKHSDLQFERVEYVEGPAVARLNVRILNRYAPNDLDIIWRALFCQKSKSKWSYQGEVRFLYFESNAPNEYTGRAFALPCGAIKKVFVQSDFISSEHLHELKTLISEYETRCNTQIEIVRF